MKHKSKIIVGAVIIAVLAFMFWYGGDAPGLRGWTPQPKGSVEVPQNDVSIPTDLPTSTETPVAQTTEDEQIEAEQKVSEIPIKEADESATEENKPQSTDGTALTPAEKVALADRIAEESATSSVENGDKVYSVQNGMVINESTGKDKYFTDPVPEGKPLPIEPQDAVISDKELTCTLSVRCDTILRNIAWLDKEKASIVPKDGVIFAEKTVTFYEGESVFNLLLREMKRNKIHMEFEDTPIYNSAYIEGIANLYEFDCGELSGWMYKVNGWFPNYGCSRYQLKAGDKVEWVYTCDLGVDVRGYYAASGN
ncbi:MAG: DUF4430 domain-containing protein [Clostridia bacterium]|jgi:hypothetical protein|nr:DUF4430 domain-containing protein [Clostridia bacterium]